MKIKSHKVRISKLETNNIYRGPYIFFTLTYYSQGITRSLLRTRRSAGTYVGAVGEDVEEALRGWTRSSRKGSGPEGPGSAPCCYSVGSANNSAAFPASVETTHAYNPDRRVLQAPCFSV